MLYLNKRLLDKGTLVLTPVYLYPIIVRFNLIFFNNYNYSYLYMSSVHALLSTSVPLSNNRSFHYALSYYYVLFIFTDEGDLSTFSTTDGIYQVVLPSQSTINCILQFSPKNV